MKKATMAPVGDENDLPDLYVRLDGKEDANEICFMLRGLFAAVANSDGQYKKNQEFRRGVTVSFGSGSIAGLFLEKFERVFRKGVRKRVFLRRQ